MIIRYLKRDVYFICTVLIIKYNSMLRFTSSSVCALCCCLLELQRGRREAGGGEEEGTYIRQTAQRPNRNLALAASASCLHPFIPKNARALSGYWPYDYRAGFHGEPSEIVHGLGDYDL